MDVKTLLISTGMSVLLLTPIAIKCQVRLRKSVPGAVVIGLIAGLIVHAISGFIAGWGLMGQVLLQIFLIGAITVGSVAYMFYRDPERTPPEQGGVIVSPADGTVIYVKEIAHGKAPLSEKKGRQFELAELAQTEFTTDDGYLIGIGMNFLNVHVNRAPIEGKVEMIRHIKGSFWSLKRPEAVLANERLTTVIDGGSFKVAVVQIASRLVRRIVSYLAEGQTVKKGQRIGIIKFGSQVDLIVPKLEGIRVKVRSGDEVLAGVSILVEYESGSNRIEGLAVSNAAGA